jgi:hypothetical protein
LVLMTLVKTILSHMKSIQPYLMLSVSLNRK